MPAVRIEVEQEKDGYGLFNLNLSKFSLLGKSPKLSTGYLNPSRYSLMSGSKESSYSLGYLNPNRYRLNLGSAAKSFLRLPATQRTLVKPVTQKTGFLSKIGGFFSNLFQKSQPILQSYLQYKLAKNQLKWQAKLMQAQSGAYPPTGGGYPTGGGVGETIMAPAYPPPKDNTGKYLLLGGAALAGILLIVMMNRD